MRPHADGMTGESREMRENATPAKAPAIVDEVERQKCRSTLVFQLNTVDESTVQFCTVLFSYHFCPGRA